MASTKVEIPFCGPAYSGDSLFSAAQECINFYLRPYPDFNPANKGETKFMLVGTPGLDELVDFGNDGPVRGMIRHGHLLYVVSWSKLFSVNDGWNAIELGTLGSNSGHVGMACNGVDVIVVDGFLGYTYTIATDTFSQIADADFPNGATNVEYLDGYYLVNEPDTGRVWRSDFNDGTSWEPLQYSEAGSHPDDVISLLSDHEDLWVFGEFTTEPWYNTGGSGFNFAAISGALLDIGIAGAFARCSINRAVYLVGQGYDGRAFVVQLLGRSPKVISSFPIEYQLSQEADLSDVTMFGYHQLGHSFVVINLSSSTWVYDSTIGQWHQRSSRVAGVDGRWRVNCHRMFAGVNVVGDFYDGKLYQLNPDTYDENGNTLISTRTGQTMRYLQKRITYWDLQVLFEPGVGLVAGTGSDPKAILQWSDDGGRNWSSDRELSLGAIGATDNRAIWHQLGQGRNRVFKVSVSDPVKRVILGAVASVEIDDA